MSSNLSSSELVQAVRVFQIHKAFKKTFVDSPPQTKVLVSFLIPLIAGFLVYSFIHTPVIQLVIFSIIALLFGLLLYSIGSNYAENWGIITAFLVGACYWFYVFINTYRKQQSDQDIGKKIFICNPSGVCDTDGVKGPYNGEDKYVFSPPSKPDETYNYIPKNQFDIRISDQFTYMFWIKIDYSKWISSNFYGRDKIILMKGNNIGTSDLAVWALPVNEALQFDIGTNIPGKPVSLSTNFSFDKWIHYSIVVNNKVVELYKNATLEKSALMTGTFTLKNTPLYLGRTPQNSEYDKFPGQILYLSYNNSNLMPSEIYDIYQKEYSNISKVAEDINNNLNEPQNNSNNCVNSNSSCNEDNNFQSTILSDEQGIEYQQGQPITLPSDIIKNSDIMSNYQKIINT
jgi:hypothetical protein